VRRSRCAVYCAFLPGLKDSSKPTPRIPCPPDRAEHGRTDRGRMVEAGFRAGLLAIARANGCRRLPVRGRLTTYLDTLIDSDQRAGSPRSLARQRDAMAAFRAVNGLRLGLCSLASMVVLVYGTTPRNRQRINGGRAGWVGILRALLPTSCQEPPAASSGPRTVGATRVSVWRPRCG